MILVVLLAAPLASFGEQPGNTRRETRDRPSRSTLIGLAGAALGVDREDAERQAALSASFFTGTRTLRTGALISDFHTFQSLPGGKGPVSTRAQALAVRRDLATSVTRREYRSDGLWQAAYLARDGASFTPDALQAAFLKPHFGLWLGRKSCPLSRPLDPLVVEHAGVEVAFVVHARHVNKRNGARLLPEQGGDIALDARVASSAQVNAKRRERRIDDPGDRRRWQFSARYEDVYPMPAQSEAGET